MASLPDDLRLSHFSTKPLGAIHSVVQAWRSEHRSCFEKPKGFWVSVDGDDDWQSWCTSENFGIGSTRYTVELVSDPNLLVLPSPGDLETFSERFGREHRWGPNKEWTDRYIDWPAVAAEYHGIIIAPYHWSQRMNLDWYYGWDCASGCIWNADAIARIEEHREAA